MKHNAAGLLSLFCAGLIDQKEYALRSRLLRLRVQEQNRREFKAIALRRALRGDPDAMRS